MANDDLERLARAYRDRLENRGTGGYQAAIALSEQGLALADALLCGARQPNYALTYLRNLKEDTLSRLYALEGARPVPGFRAPRRGTNLYNRLVDLEIELLTELDALDNTASQLNEIFRNESRVLSLLGILRGF